MPDLKSINKVIHLRAPKPGDLLIVEVDGRPSEIRLIQQRLTLLFQAYPKVRWLFFLKGDARFAGILKQSEAVDEIYNKLVADEFNLLNQEGNGQDRAPRDLLKEIAETAQVLATDLKRGSKHDVTLACLEVLLEDYAEEQKNAL